jgi:hypothetical protein
VEELLKAAGRRLTAAEHDIHPGAQTDSAIHGDEHGMIKHFGDNAVEEVEEEGSKAHDQTDKEDRLQEAHQRKHDASEKEDQQNVEEGVENDGDKKRLNTQWMNMHNLLGVAQGHNTLTNNTMEGGDMFTKRREFEDTEEVTDEDIKGTEEEGSKDEDNTEDVTGYDRDEEDEKREAMLTNIDSKYNKVNVFLKGSGLKTNAVEHELHRGARTDIITHGDDHGMIRLFGGNAVKNTPDKSSGKSKDPNEGRSMSDNVEYKPTI